MIPDINTVKRAAPTSTFFFVTFFVCTFQEVCLFTANNSITAINPYVYFDFHNLRKWQNQSHMNWEITEMLMVFLKGINRFCLFWVMHDQLSGFRAAERLISLHWEQFLILGEQSNWENQKLHRSGSHFSLIRCVWCHFALGYLLFSSFAIRNILYSFLLHKHIIKFQCTHLSSYFAIRCLWVEHTVVSLVWALWARRQTTFLKPKRRLLFWYLEG